MKLKVWFAFLTLGFVVFLYSCTKLNEPTELGDELLPVVDNVNTFDTTLDAQTAYYPYDDSSRHLITDNMALGQINDPAFGNTTADMFFNLSSSVYGSYPYYNKDSLVAIDSVVLTLAYAGSYGDTASGSSRVNVDVAEILPDNGFNDTTFYRFDNPGFTTGPTLGTATFTPSQFKDTVTLIRAGDTTKMVNVMRIRLSNLLGERLTQFDTTTSSNGGYKTDSIFRLLFRGLAVKTTDVSGPGVLSYFNVAGGNTSLTVYFRNKRNGGIDTSAAVYQHLTYSQANSIIRTPGGEYAASMGQPSPEQLYVQSAPTGSYVAINIPKLTGFPNKIIHRAELIAVKVPSPSDNIFTVPNRLMLDHKGPSDTAYLFENDVQIGANNAFDFTLFGGTLRKDNSYRFNITRYVQGIVTRQDRNDTIRLYAPLRTRVYGKSYRQYFSVPNLNNIANGRVVLASGSHPNPEMRLRLRIIYSNL